ncbi:ATP-binding protein [Hymenobacter monticola]|uniref:histidine kinase n=2 Tax=Hymenobacter TaxID=89966 RepID=A0ABY4BBQ6_9BACT|nr:MULTISPECIES: PAS domain-containing sensor histidine kinase [Hymenobacter]MDU0372289.1 PAS domain-containing sensor histidine kinase [Hymenobacter endophyticus]UOE36567.1 PAS domain-containing sensor histidine kinase [Hymenobacter monticola]
MTNYPLLFSSLLDRGKAVHFAYHVQEQRVVYVSQAYELVIGGRQDTVNEELPGWLARIHPDDLRHLRQRLPHALLGELVQDVEVRVMQPDGRIQWLCFSAAREELRDGQVYLSGTVLDMTRSKETSLNAQKFNTKKDATLEILSHDLAAPLALLQQLTEELRHEAQGRATEAMQQLLQLMQRTCTEGVNLIRDFVDNEFLESANVVLHQERTDLASWLATIMEEYQRSERHTHLRFAFEAPAQPVYVCLDINKFQQVINNLISNAIKFTPDGGCITLRLEQCAGRAVVRVADTGVGIPEPLQPVLFEKFTKARRPGLRGEKTTGLGMSIIQTIVELHAGTIRFTSREDQGSVFIIDIPALPAT